MSGGRRKYGRRIARVGKSKLMLPARIISALSYHRMLLFMVAALLIALLIALSVAVWVITRQEPDLAWIRIIRIWTGWCWNGVGDGCRTYVD